jgi:FG-GAP repeat
MVMLRVPVVVVLGGVLLSVAGCNTAPPNCGLNQRYEPGFRSCIPLCGTREAPINASCFDQDSGTVREAGVEPTDGGAATDVSETDARDAAMDTADVVGADASDAGGCGAGREMAGGACDVKVPRAIAPLSTARVSSRTPRLKWVLPDGVTGAHVEVCADRLCARLLEEGDATSEWAPTRELPTGVVFWRVRGTVGGARSARTSPTWWMWVPARSAAGGVQTSWGSVPDVNGDGLGDLVVGDRIESECDAGVCRDRLSVFLAGPSRLDLARAPQVIEGDSAQSGIATALATTDVNGDGYADVVVGEPFSGGAEPLWRGAFRVLHGSATGALTEAFAARGTIEAESLGLAVAGLGDVNGDGFGDVAVGALGASPGGATLAGEVRVYWGSVAGVSAARSQSVARMEARRAFGFGLHAVGDVNGDGFADMVVSDVGTVTVPRTAARAYLYLGSSTGFSTAAARVWTDMDTGTTFGIGGGAGDFNGDGFADIWLNNIFSKSDDSGLSRIDVFLGRASGPGAAADSSILGTASTSLMFDRYESAVGTGGVVADVDRDGFDDLIAMARVEATMSSTYPLRLFRGSSSGLAIAYSAVLPAVESPYENASYDVAVLGDVNGDARVDFAVIRETSGPDAPGLLLFHGGASALEPVIQSQRAPGSARRWSRVLSGR